VNPLHTRLGLLAPTTTPLWTGTANGAQSSTFTLAVTTVSGALPTDSSGLLLVRAGVDLVRMKSHSGSTLYLAENPLTFTAGDALAVYDLRLPWPRYQRLVSTTVYKDYDIAFPATWQHSLPPAALVTPEVAWLDIGDTQVFSALNSQVMAPDPASGLTATWDCAGWGTGTAYGSAGGVTNCYFPLTPTATGLHYLKCTLTDEWGGAFSRYVAVWVGTTPTAVLGASLDWSLERGWRGSVTLDGTLTWFDYSPVALVDLDTAEIIFYGFYSPQRVSGDLGMETTEAELLSPLNAASALYGYPFIVTDLADPGSTPPDNWAEVGKLTCARALWYLLAWHSVLPQLANLYLGDPTARRIAGQTFSAGNLLNLIGQVTQAAFYVLRAAATGALTLEVQPLYADAATWAGLPAYTLTAANRSAAYTYTPPQARCSEVRVSGVYLAVGDDYAPAIARCPAHPAAWGAGTQEVTKLAPLSAAELLQWAGRHFAVENQAATVDVDVYVEIDPSWARVATDIPDAPSLALDSLRLAYDPGALSWRTQLSARTYSAAPSADYVPIPPAVVIPPPSPPPVLPPIDPLPPVLTWPTIVYVGTRLGGIYHTTDFNAESATQPTWVLDSAIAGGGTLTTIRQLGADPLAPGDWQYCIDTTSRTLYRHTELGGDWTPILTNAQAQAAILAGGGPDLPCRIDIFATEKTTGTLFVIAIITDGVYGDYAWRLTSTDHGSTWSDPLEMHDEGTGEVESFIVQGNYIWYSRVGRIIAGLYSGATWTWRYRSYEMLCVDYTFPELAWSRGDRGDRLYSHQWEMGSLIDTPYFDTNPSIRSADAMWFDPANMEHQYMLWYDSGTGAGLLYETPDAWITWSLVVEHGPITPGDFWGMWPYAAYPTHVLIGRRKNTSLGSVNPHTLHIMNGLSDTTPIGRAGISPGVSPYTGSIPQSSQGLCEIGGVVIVR